MESFNNAAVIWFVAGFVLFVLEFLIPGFILFFFAVGAWIAAITTLFFDISINTQLVIFMSSSLVTLLFFRKWVKKIILTRKESSEIEDEFIGKKGKADTFIGPGQNGKVDFKGTTWDAQSEDVIAKGENVVIIGNDSIILIVKSSKTLS